MKKEDLNFIIEQGEGQLIEFKETLDKSIVKEIVAFANANGGRIFIGITDAGKIKGFELTNKIKSQIQDLGNNCEPRINIKMKQFQNLAIIESKPKFDNYEHSFYITLFDNNYPNKIYPKELPKRTTQKNYPKELPKKIPQKNSPKKIYKRI